MPSNSNYPRLVRLLIWIVLSFVALAACEFPAGSDCDADDISAPVNLLPAWGSFVDGPSPTLMWDYAGSCEPDAYHIRLYGGGETQDASVDALSTAWIPYAALEPATSYRWSVQAVSGSTSGAYAIASFRTNPSCDLSDPVSASAPELRSPADGAVVTAPVTAVSAEGEVLDRGFRVDLDWEAPSGCLLPYGYRVELSRSASFAPSMIVASWDELDPPALFMSLWYEWHDCDRYYWRVSPLLDYDVVGPASETWSFVVNTSGAFCPLEFAEPLVEPEIPAIPIPSTAHGAIAGHVWHDECAVPYESTDVAPPGCVIMPDGGMEANGVLDSGESGIEGVTVLLATGTCPGSGGWSYTTDASGYYTFHDLTAGTYCIEIDAAADGNEEVLIPGNWTVPYRWYGPGPISAEVFLGSDDDISRMNDFAWDYQFLPAPSAVTPSGTPFARVIENARCRSGPGVVYPLVTFVSQGQSFPIQGRNAEGTWWWIDRLDGDCWLADSVIETEGDTGSVPQQESPPTPTITPILGCWQRPVQGPMQCVVPCPPDVENPSYCTP